MDTTLESLDPNLNTVNMLLPEENPQQKLLRDSLFEFPRAQARLRSLHGKWAEEQTKTESRRLVRNIDISVQSLRQQGKLRADDSIVPIRLIDMNIRREQPSYINYLKGSNRLAIFTCLSNPREKTEQLESEFTNGNQYLGWETPHFKVLDGSQTHGWDSVEVVFDETKPLHVAIEHVGHENLYFGMESINLQTCEVIVRKYSFSQMQLRMAVTDFGFSEQQVNSILDKYNADTTKDSNIIVYKKFFKFEKVVYVAWYSLTEGVSDWLKAPAKLYLGRRKQVQKTVMQESVMVNAFGQPQVVQQPQVVMEWQDIDEDEFPIFILPYSETEQQTIVSHKGRVFFDMHKQEGMTAITSGFVNSINRASNVYGSVEGEPGTTAAPKQLDTELVHGKIYDRKINFWGHQFPDPTTLNALQHLDTQNSSETGQPTFAVNNRKDSRKTATEVSAAQEQQSLLSGVQVSLYSTFLRSVYSYIWKIVQSQALQNKIRLLLTEKSDIQLGQEQPVKRYVNDVARIAMDYNIKAAGDVDVIQRSELRSKMQQDWPVMATTPLAGAFLSEYIKLSYPAMADKWIPILEQGDATKQVVAKLADMVMTLSDQNAIMQLPPDAKQEIGDTLAAAQQLIAGNNEQTQQ